MPLSTRTFGVEIECIMPYGMGRTDIASKLRAMTGMPIKTSPYNSPTATCWKVQPDRSVGAQGCELVSPVLSGEAGIANVRKVADALKAIGCRVNINTGLHVHFGATGLDLKALKSLAKMYVWFESFFDHIMPKSRRRTNCTHIKSNRADFGGYGTDAVNAGIVKIDTATNLYGLVDITNPGGHHGRYRKLNLKNVTGGKGTIEFRQHSGTVEAEKIEFWIRLLDAFVTKALTTRIRKRVVTRDLLPVEEMRQMFEMIELDKPVRAFYLARRREVAAAEAAGLPIAA